MLIRLFGRNYRSFRTPFELSMVATDKGTETAWETSAGVVEVPINGWDEPLRLLRCVAIFGPNGSGKSTVLLAAWALRNLVTESSGRAKPFALIPEYEPFLLDEQSAKDVVELGCDVVFDRSILHYEIAFTGDEIHKEILEQHDEDVRTLINRQGSEEITGELIENSNANQLYVAEMQPNVSVLSKLAHHGPAKGTQSILPYYAAISQALMYEDVSLSGLLPNENERMRFVADASYREWVMQHLIRAADVGICAVETRVEDCVIPLAERLDRIAERLDRKTLSALQTKPRQRPAITFIHDGAAKKPIAFDKESAGTKKLLDIGPHWFAMAQGNITVFVDELGAGLHPTLLDRLIRVVNHRPESDPASQLIFSTQDTELLESHNSLLPALRRDQVFFTEKNAKGESKLYGLLEYREEDAGKYTRRRYLAGRYGAIPIVEKMSL
jgi:hypothetical protein